MGGVKYCRAEREREEVEVEMGCEKEAWGNILLARAKRKGWEAKPVKELLNFVE